MLKSSNFREAWHSMGWQRVGNDLVTEQQRLLIFINLSIWQVFIKGLLCTTCWAYYCEWIFVLMAPAIQYKEINMKYTNKILAVCPVLVRGVCVLRAQSCLTLCYPMDCSPQGSSVYGISQARILEWVAISSSRGSSWPRDRTHVSCIFWTDDRTLGRKNNKTRRRKGTYGGVRQG